MDRGAFLFPMDLPRSPQNLLSRNFLDIFDFTL
jgi:hypothetical protein